MDEPETDHGQAGWRHQPALDGVRAVAVAAVLAFHGEVPGFSGGYVGVSVFFTLSGFLITSLLIREHRRTGAIAAGAFYARRARRLLPASALCLAAVAVLAAGGAFDAVPDLRRQFVGAALQVYNWVALGGGGSYADLFGQASGAISPLEHYWSLAIEEQFYWVWPPTFAALAVLSRRRGWPLVRVLAVPTVAFVAAGPAIAAAWGPDAAYWATPARIGEILTGATAAALVADRGAPTWTRRATPLALVAILAACVTFPTVGGPAYAGWLPALSTVTVVLLLGLQHPGPVRRALSIRPLVALGAISYGVYLFHWPIFVVVDEARLGTGGAVLFGVRVGLTLVAAVVSYVLVEQPVRRLRTPPRPTLVAGLGLTAACVALVVVVPRTGTTFDTAGDDAAAAAIAPDAPAEALEAVGGDTGSGTDGPATPSDPAALEASRRQLVLEAPTPSRPVRILVVGDSTAEATGGGLVRWAAANPELAQVTIRAKPGCGFVQGGIRVFPEGEQEISPECAAYVGDELPAAVAELQPDVVVAMTTAWDVIDQRFEGTGPEAPTDPTYRARIGEDLPAATDAMLAAGAPTVVWIAEPTVNPIWAAVISPQEDPARHGVLHDAMRSIAAGHPDRVAVADLAWWIDEAGWADDRDARPDGVHLDASAAERVATDWLGPLVVAEALRGR